MKTSLTLSDPRTLNDFVRWAGLILLVAAPSAGLGLLTCTRNLVPMVVIAGSVFAIAAAFATGAVVASRLGNPVIDRILAACRGALWIKAALAAMLVGIVADIFGGAQAIQAWQWVINTARIRDQVGNDSIANTLALCGLEAGVVLVQVAAIAGFLLLARLEPQVGKVITRCQRAIGMEPER
ncbi:MAG TPA: hypothetical protein VHD32_13355 [Candidatus Didemnitutus sp.]|nr:hypothetical protein [Candidatus Didemnitutus sp.]